MNDRVNPLPKRILVRGVGYDYLYSRGLIANHIKVRGVDYDTAYQIAREVEEALPEFTALIYHLMVGR